MSNPSSYSKAVGVAIARLVAEGLSLRRIAKLIPRSAVQLSRWAHLPSDPELRRLLALARAAAVGDRECEEALFSPPRRQVEVLDALLSTMPESAEEISVKLRNRIPAAQRLACRTAPRGDVTIRATYW